MTKPKPSIYRAKTGRKTKREKANQDSTLKMLFEMGELAPLESSFYARCGYDYALKKFQEFRNERNRMHQEYIKAHPPDDPQTMAQNVEDYLIEHIGKSNYKRLFLRERNSSLECHPEFRSGETPKNP